MTATLRSALGMGALAMRVLRTDEAPEPSPLEDGGWVVPAAIAVFVVVAVVVAITVAVRRGRR